MGDGGRGASLPTGSSTSHLCRPGPTVSGLCPSGQENLRRRGQRQVDLEHEPACFSPPGDFGRPVRSDLAGPGRREGAPRRRLYDDRPVPGLTGASPATTRCRKSATAPEGVVVERRHLARVDRTVGQHAVPAFPDRRRSH